MTTKGAGSVTKTLDKLAQLFQTNDEILGLDKEASHEFAQRCDILSDHIEKQAEANALKSSDSDSVIKFKNVLKKIINE